MQTKNAFMEEADKLSQQVMGLANAPGKENVGAVPHGGRFAAELPLDHSTYDPSAAGAAPPQRC